MHSGKAQFDIAVIGAGMAGASVAAELSAHASVVLLEMEPQPGYHTTGRSAALFSEIYGPAPIRALTRASRQFFEDPPESFSDVPLLSRRGVLLIARSDQAGAIDRMTDELAGSSQVTRLDADETRSRLPLLRQGYAVASLYDPIARDIDVHALHQGYLRMFRSNGGRFEGRAEVNALTRLGNAWRVAANDRRIRAGTIVNSAGAWADNVGAMAGAQPLGLVPKRRTAAIIAAPDGIDPDGWPMAVDIEEQFYMKPDAGRLLVSPADETPSDPCDSQPEEIDIAVCIERIETAFELQVRHIMNKWAGLRTFLPDKVPASGFDPLAENFFWLAGQGGYGIQSAPALARLAASQILDEPVPPELGRHGVRPSDLAPGRFGNGPIPG
jgi:D-arginine dehydrogenase